MSPDLATLRDLLARTQGDAAQDRRLAGDINVAFFANVDEMQLATGRLRIADSTSSLDDAICLADQFGIVFEIARHPWDERNEFRAKICLRMAGRNGHISVIDTKPAPTRPLAVLVSLFANLITKLEMDAEDRDAALSDLAASDAETQS